MVGEVFTEVKPAHSFGEAVDHVAGDAKKIGSDIVKEIKAIDTTAIKNKLAGFWNKIKGSPKNANQPQAQVEQKAEEHPQEKEQTEEEKKE